MIRLVKYFCVGGVAATLDICLFTFFASYLNFPWVYVSIASFVLATTLNYFLSVKYVFQSGLRYEKNQEIAYVFLVSGLALLVNQIVLYVAIVSFGASLLFSKILATGAVFIFNYLGRARFIF
jgi:putative flippase GtrA